MTQFDLTKVTTSIVERYEVDITLPPYPEDRTLFIASPGPGVEVTRIKVDVDPAEDESGKYFVSFTATGYTLTQKGERNKRPGYANTLYWGDGDEARWNLRREAILATLTRHGIDPETLVEDRFLVTWTEHSEAMRGYFTDRFGSKDN